MDYGMIAQRAFNTPLLVEPTKGFAFVAGLGARLLGREVTTRGAEVSDDRLARAGRLAPRASIIGDDVGARAERNGRRLFTLRDGIAIIEVTGTLVHRGEWIGESSGVTSYEGLAAQVEAAASDPQVRGIALEIDSFGGEVAGAFDLADAIRAARARKPVWAFVAEHALSAGYAMASQADRIILPRTGEVGSIGVLVMHVDWSQRLSDEGAVVTLIHAGAHKVDANPYEPLPEAVRDDLQAEVEDLRDLFVATVAAGRRQRLSEAAARNTQARTYRGAQAVAAGLADEVADLRAAFRGFAAQVNGRPRAVPTGATGRGKGKETTMSKKNTPAAEEVAAIEDTEDDEVAVVVAEEDEDEKVPAEASASAAAASGPVPRPAAAAAASIDRAAAAEILEVVAQAGRLGVKVDGAKAIREGMSADALRKAVMDRLADSGDAANVLAVKEPTGAKPGGSPIVAAAKKSAEAGANAASGGGLLAAARRAAAAH